jgi:cell wall-associated NlpC family hydrolase
MRRSAAAVVLALVGSLLPAATAAPAGAATPTASYLRPTDHIVPARGCTVLTPGMNGVKVKLVQRRLKLPRSTWETMGPSTIAAVKAFQRSRGLRATGVVDATTWKALGLRESFCMDRYQAKPALPLTATAAQRREQLIRYALTYLGVEYVWGGAGPGWYGVDCSGLVLQALYSAGLDPQPISVDKHVLPSYRTSLELYRHPRLRHVPVRLAQRGDLLFWKKNSTGLVNHIAIYLGKGRVLEASSGADKVRYATWGNRPASGQTMMPTAVRPF